MSLKYEPASEPLHIDVKHNQFHNADSSHALEAKLPCAHSKHQFLKVKKKTDTSFLR